MSILALAAITWSVMELAEVKERHDWWRESVKYCQSVGKPLLRIGIRRGPFEPPNGDVTLDLDPIVLGIKGGVVGDERCMPFSDKQFGVCFNEHTIEHLYSAEDVELSISECMRVADYAVILAPSPYSFGGLFHPDHKLRVWFKNNNKIVVKEKPYVEDWQNWPPA